MKTSENTKSTIRCREGKVEFASNSKAEHNNKYKLGGKVDKSKIDDGKIEDNEIRKKNQKTSKSKNLSKSKKTIEFSNFFTTAARLAFTKLRQVFVKASILHHFDLECHI